MSPEITIFRFKDPVNTAVRAMVPDMDGEYQTEELGRIIISDIDNINPQALLNEIGIRVPDRDPKESERPGRIRKVQLGPSGVGVTMLDATIGLKVRLARSIRETSVWARTDKKQRKK